jgi:hypothetical protein
MDVDQVGSPQRSDWEVNDIVKLIIKWVPRRRWCCLNSEHFGPLFSVSALIEVPMADIERLLDAPEVSWLNWLNRQGNKWLHRPSKKRSFQDKTIVKSTKNKFVVLLYVDTHGPPTCEPEEQLDAVREGWDSLDPATQASITEKAENGVYGIEPPRRGWKGLECPPDASQPQRRTRRGGERGSAPPPKRVEAHRARDAPVRRASAPAALERQPDDDDGVVVAAPAPAAPPSLAEGLKILGRAIAHIKGAGGPAERAALIGEFVAGFTEGQHGDRKQELRDVVDVATATGPVDFDKDINALKLLGQRVHFELEKKNGCKGIGAFVTPSGCLVSWDPATDVTSKTAVAPRLMVAASPFPDVKCFCSPRPRRRRKRRRSRAWRTRSAAGSWRAGSSSSGRRKTSPASV